MTNATALENSYYQWLKQDLNFADLDQDYVAISTPFVNPDFDNISLYARFLDPRHDQLELSDFGDTRFHLLEAGITITRRNTTINRSYRQVLSDFGVQENGEALQIRTSLDNFPAAKARLLQAIIRINDLTELRHRPRQAPFADRVANFLRQNQILYTPAIEITNSAGLTSHFDFAIPQSTGPEQLIKTTARPNNVNAAKVFNFDVQATAPVRPAQFILLVDGQSQTNAPSPQLIKTATSNLNPRLARVLNFATLTSKQGQTLTN